MRKKKMPMKILINKIVQISVILQLFKADRKMIGRFSKTTLKLHEIRNGSGGISRINAQNSGLLSYLCSVLF
jgi:hypothetical protein